jgi:hypothetical protein
MDYQNLCIRYKKIRFRCKKSGSLAKSTKTFTTRKLNYFHYKKMTHKGENYSVKRQQNYFCNGTLKKRGKRMIEKDEKPDTLTTSLYIIGFIICGYFIVRAIIIL